MAKCQRQQVQLHQDQVDRRLLVVVVVVVVVMADR